MLKTQENWQRILKTSETEINELETHTTKLKQQDTSLAMLIIQQTKEHRTSNSCQKQDKQMEAVNRYEETFMYIQVVKQASKLRLRIINAYGYDQTLNCSGPKAIRREGYLYLLKNPKVSLVQKYNELPFYKLPNNISAYERIDISQVNNNQAQKIVSIDDLKALGLPVYEQTECVICLSNAPSSLIKPCYHFCICDECVAHLQKSSNKCPMCRGTIVELIKMAPKLEE